MITLCEKNKCTGCAACFNACELGCISMQASDDGFFYPKIDSKNCIECKRCIYSCPVLTKFSLKNYEKPQVYAAYNKDAEIRLISSSGGIFLALAHSIINEGGIVFGAAFTEDMIVKHERADDITKCLKFVGSKYVQSDIGENYKYTKSLLQNGIKVLFSGTPCQISGLLSYLGKYYENLLTCDFVCHGVPSPGVFSDYIHKLEKTYGRKIKNINFRKKSKNGNYSLIIKFENGYEYFKYANDDEYYRSFLSNIILRESCYECEFSKPPRSADITLGDFHGIGIIDSKQKENETLGISIILLNSMKGENRINLIKKSLWMEERDFDEARGFNRIEYKPYEIPKTRGVFFSCYKEKGYEVARKKIQITLRNKVGNYLNPNVKRSILNLLNSILFIKSNYEK